MEKPFDRRSFIHLLGALTLSACATDAAAPPVAAAPARVSSYRYDSVAGSSQVTLERGDTGRELLRGTTDLPTPSDPTSRTLAKESVALDHRGRLEHAVIVVSRSGNPDARYTFDANRGTVRVERSGSPAFDWQVPVDAPWSYAPAFEGDADLRVTPIGAWVALRATGAASVVRVLNPEHQQSHLVMVDQIAVRTERGTTVALGYDGVDADERFVTEVRLFHGAVTLGRVAAVDLGA